MDASQNQSVTCIGIGQQINIKQRDQCDSNWKPKVFDGEVFHNQKVYIPKQIYIYSQPYKRDVSDPNDMIAFISLYDNPVNPSQHILQCGFIDNVF